MLKELLELQKTDLMIDDLVRKEKNLPGKAERLKLQEELSVIEAKLSQIEARIKQAKLQQDKLDGEVNIIDSKIKTTNDRLYSGTVTNPKELTDIQSKIKQLTSQKDSLEDKDIRAMEEVSVLEISQNNFLEKAGSLKANIEKLSLSIKNESKAIQDELAGLREKRTGQKSGINPDLLEEYEKLRREKQGLAIATIEDGACQACHVEMPAVDIDKMKPGEKNYCPFCERIVKV